ncbi:hypothetical protein ACSZNZ_22935 [Aeromonas caviae]|uniref:hypothetical protein n=1 Tax=Gammaproteobacteria TaxID=1236 RepID=UPI0037CD4DDD
MAKLLKKLFRCPLDRDLIMVWREVTGEYAFGQTETATKIYIGRYVVMRWTTFHRPPIGDDC